MFARKADQRLVGFVDLGSANRDRERLIADDTADSTNGRVRVYGWSSVQKHH